MGIWGVLGALGCRPHPTSRVPTVAATLRVGEEAARRVTAPEAADVVGLEVRGVR